MRKPILLALSLGLLLTGCDSTTSTSPIQRPEGLWALSSLTRADGSSIGVDNPDRYTASFSPDGAFNARVDCNVCGSTYQVAGSNLTIGLMACTRAYCAPPSLHDEYVTALGSVMSFEVRDSRLVITHAGGTLTFLKKG